MDKETPIPAGHALKLIKIGNSTGVILPKELLERMGLAQGDSLTIVREGEGFTLTPHGPEFETQMKAADDVMKEDAPVLRALAGIDRDS